VLFANGLRVDKGKKELFEHALQHAGLVPAAHARIDRMPVAEPLWQAPPLAAVLGHIQHGVDHLQVGQADVAVLCWQVMLDTSKLLV
jgi:hypothetical protein